jgi:hypothetical protein
VEGNTTINVGTYKEDYSGLTEGAKGRIMVTPIWPFYPSDGLNSSEGMTSLVLSLHNNENEIVRNTADLAKLTFSKTGNWPTRTSGSFDLGVARPSSSGSWENGLYDLIGDTVTQADLPDKVVVEFTYKGVLFVIEKEVEITPEMFKSEPTPQDITVQSLNQTYILDSYYKGLNSTFSFGGNDLLEKTVTIKAELYGDENELLATSVYKDVNSLLNSWKNQQSTGQFLMVPFVLSGDVEEKWETTWADGNPSKDNVPAKVVMTVIDDIGLTYTAEESNITSMPAGTAWEDLFPSDDASISGITVAADKLLSHLSSNQCSNGRK